MATRLSFIIVFLLVACAMPDSDQKTSEQLKTGRWQINTMGSSPIVKGTTPWLEFNLEQNRINANAGCNGLGTNFELLPNQQLKLEPVVGSKRYCAKPEGVMVQERELTRILSELRQFELNKGQLQLLDENGNLLLSASQ